MSELELILREIEDKHTRENFARLLRYVQEEPILQGNWKLHEYFTDKAVTNFRMEHNHGFVPSDIITLSVVGDRNWQFNYDKFTKKHLDITTAGATKIRFLSGSYKERLNPTNALLPDVPIGTGPAGPPGPPGPTPPSVPALTDTFDTNTGTAVGDLVRLTSTNFVQNFTDNGNTTIPHGIFGVGIDKPTTTTMEVQFIGIADFYSGLTAGQPVFVSTSGALTQTKPPTGVVQQIGFATSTTALFVQKMQALKQV